MIDNKGDNEYWFVKMSQKYSVYFVMVYAFNLCDNCLSILLCN